MELGGYGVWASYRTLGEENAGEAAKLVEELGFGAFWLGGSPKVPATRPLLLATERITVATGILNMWQNDPADVAKAHHELTDAFPGRFLLGIGAGHPEATSDYKRPFTAMRNFLDGLDQAENPVPERERALAALGPRMLDLAKQRAKGTHPYFVTAEHTRAAREELGPDKLVAPEMACVLDPDPVTARETARGYAKLYLGLTNYTSNLLRHGFSEQDLADGGSDRLIDQVIPHGTADQIAGAARAHREAGADHVCLQPVGVTGIPREQWTALASALELH